MLTDGTVPALDWNNGGSAQWVGWHDGDPINYPNENDPTVTFYFASTVTVNSVTAWVDNTNGSGPTTYTFSGLNLAGSSATVQFNQNPTYGWVMVGEVQFQGTGGAAVPEPATWALMAGGVALALLRRRLSF